MDDGQNVKILAWEHPAETARWDIAGLWDDLDGVTETVAPPLVTGAKHVSEDSTFSLLDSLALDDARLRERIFQLAPQFGRVVLDSWYIAQSAYVTGVHAWDNVVQLTQSRPEFTPEDPTKAWKARAFSLLPHVNARRLFTCRNYMNEYGNPDNNRYIGAYVDAPFFTAQHSPSAISTGGLDLITVTSTPAIPEKGIQELFTGIASAVANGVKIRRLTILSGQQLPSALHTLGVEVNFVHNPDRTTQTQLLEAADVYVTHTRHETPGLAQLEALAVGLPSIAVDSGGNRDYYTGDNFVMIKDLYDFSNELAHIHDLDYRNKLSINARQSARRFTEAAMRQRFVNALNELIPIVE